MICGILSHCQTTCLHFGYRKVVSQQYYENSREKNQYLKDEKTAIRKKCSKDLIKSSRAKSMSQVHLAPTSSSTILGTWLVPNT